MSADSLRYLPYVTVNIPSKRNGTTTTDNGVFTLIAEKGDTLEFSSVGYVKSLFNYSTYVARHILLNSDHHTS